MSSYTLVIVDVQPGIAGEHGSSCPWSACVTDELVVAIEREIEQAKMQDCPIVDVTVDYWGYNDDWFGPTDKRLSKRLKGYKRHRSCSKMASMDGSLSIINCCRQGKFADLKNLRVVGCRTNGCVLALVEGLRRELPDAEICVVKDACNDFPQYIDWSAFEKIPALRLLEGGEKAA